MDKEALKPCPFCGSKDVICANSPVNMVYPNGACFDCGAKGPVVRERGEEAAVKAAILWNTRALSQGEER